MAPDHQNTDNSRHEEENQEAAGGMFRRKLKLVVINLKGGNSTQKIRRVA